MKLIINFYNFTLVIVEGFSWYNTPIIIFDYAVFTGPEDFV